MQDPNLDEDLVQNEMSVAAEPARRQESTSDQENIEPQIDTVNLQFLHYLIQNFDLLSKFQSLILAHVELVSYIKSKFEYKISYQLACSLSVFELTTDQTPNLPPLQNLQLPNDPTEEEQAEYEAYDLLLQKASFVQKYGRDA